MELFHSHLFNEDVMAHQSCSGEIKVRLCVAYDPFREKQKTHCHMAVVNDSRHNTHITSATKDLYMRWMKGRSIVVHGSGSRQQCCLSSPALQPILLGWKELSHQTSYHLPVPSTLADYWSDIVSNNCI